MTTLSTSATAPPSSPMIKPILRKPTTTKTTPPSILGTRRREPSSSPTRSDDDPDADGAPQAKRQKKTVVFNEALNMVREIAGKSLEQAKREVRQALEAHGRGDDEDYDALKEIFSSSSGGGGGVKEDGDGDEEEDDDDEDDGPVPGADADESRMDK